MDAEQLQCHVLHMKEMLVQNSEDFVIVSVIQVGVIGIFNRKELLCRRKF